MDVNILLRGQSNALLFADTGGLARLERGLEAASPGVDVHLLYSWTDANGANTINSGTEFLWQWMNGTEAGPLQNGLLNFIRAQSADIKDNPTLELWMHNESDQKRHWEFSSDRWKDVHVANKAMVEQAFGHAVTTEFVPIRYNWGDIGPVLDGMRKAVAEGKAAGIDMSAYDLAKMDWGGTPNTEHLSGSDAAIIADALARNLAPTVQALAAGGTPSSPQPPQPPANPATLSAGTGSDTLVLKISQDAYQGSAEYTVSVDGKQVGGTFTASASHAAGQSDTLTLKGDWAAGNHAVSVKFLNDAWGGTAATDRNLHIDSATYNGKAVAGAAQVVGDNATPGAFSFTEAAAAPANPVALSAGTGSDTLLLKISQDAYLGNAQYTVSVDGKQVGGTFTASASHAAGQSDTLTLKGDWAAGAHKVSVKFLNDKYGGSADADRNLHIDSATYNGKAVAGAAQAIPGKAVPGAFSFTEAGTTPAPVAKVGTDGADLFDTTAANSVFTGKGGRDLFLFDAGDGHATITDFATGTDKLLFLGFERADIAAAKATQGGVAGLLLTYGDNDATVFLAGVSALGAKDMAFG